MVGEDGMRDLGGGDLWLLDANLGREAIEMQWEAEGVDKYFFAVFEVLSSCI